MALPQHTYSWIAQTVNPNVPETAPAGLPGIAGLTIAAGDHVVWNATTSAYVHVRGASLNSVEARAVFIEAAGDSMVGVLNLAADPLTDMEAANKRYVDQQVASGLSQAEADLLYVSGVTAGPGLTGGGTAGDITLSLVQATQAAIGGGLIASALEIAGGTDDAKIVSSLGLRSQLGADGAILVTTAKTVVPAINEVISTIAALIGVLVFAGAYNATTSTGIYNGNGGIAQGQGPLPAPSGVNTGAYLLVTMPGAGGGANEPVGPIEVQDWLISDGAIWNLIKFGPTAIAFLPLSGGVMQGFIQLNADPTAALHPVSLQYLNANTLSQAEADALYLTQAEGDALYVNIATGDYIGSVTAGAGLTGGGTTGDITLFLVQATQTLFGGGMVATAAQIAAGVLDTSFATPLGLRGQLGADAASLVTSAKTVVPAINELISGLAAVAGVVVFGGVYDAATDTGTYNGRGGIAAGTGPLPAASVANGGTYLIVTVAGAGGGPNEPLDPMDIQDWIISDSVTWNLLKFGPATGAWLPLTGGSLSGFLTLHSDPTAAMHAATRQYVDAALGSAGTGTITGVTAGTALSGGGTTGTVTLNAVVASNAQIAAGTDILSLVSPGGLRSQLGADGATLVTAAKTVVPAINELISTIAALVGIVIFGGTYDAATNVGTYNGQGGIAAGTGPLPAAAAANGGTFLIVNVGGAGGGANEPVDSMSPQDWLISDGIEWILVKFGSQAAWLPLSGGVMSGYITLHADPTANMHPVTLQYLNTNTLSQAEADALFLTPAEGNAAYLPITTDLFTQAEADALFLTPAEGDVAYVRLAGSTMTGFLTLSADPTAPMHAVTLQYLQANSGTGGLDQATADARYVNIAGDTMTGDLNIQTNLYVGGAVYMGATGGAYIWAAPSYMVFKSFGSGYGGYVFADSADVLQATLNGLGLALSGNYVYLGGGGGAVSATGGPLLYGDANYLVFKTGSANLGFLWQDYAGAQSASLTAAGTLFLHGTGVVYSGVGEAQAIAFNWDGTQLGLWVDGGYVNLITLGGGAITNYVAKTGDTMTGQLSVPILYIQPGTAAVPTIGAITIGSRTGGAQWTYYAVDNNLCWYTGLVNRMMLTSGGDLSLTGNFSAAGAIGAGTTVYAAGDISTPANMGCNVLYAALASIAGGCNSASVGTNYILVSGNADVLGALSVTGGVSLGGLGIKYANDDNWVGFKWGVSGCELWIDNLYQGVLAYTSMLGGYLPLTGGTISGPLSVTLDIYSSQQIYCAGNMSAANMSASGAVSGYSVSAAAGGVYSAGNINAAAVIHADGYVSSNGYYYIAGVAFAYYANRATTLFCGGVRCNTSSSPGLPITITTSIPSAPMAVGRLCLI